MAVSSWRGDEISTRVLAACKEAVDETTTEAATEAEKEHWWVNRTDQLEQETISEPATVIGLSTVSGKFGTTQRRGFYGLFLEYKRPFLRPIADRVFPTLEDRIREKLR